MLTLQMAGPACNLESMVLGGTLLPLEQYDKVIVGYSGGKDCTAGVLQLLDRGVDPERIELWHQHVDGEPGSRGLMDWPCTESYCRAFAKAFGLTLRFQWKDGGFEREMLRKDAPTSGVYFEDGNGVVQYAAPAARAKGSTRLKFPQQSADLSVRWCSAYLKIDVAKRAINNDPRFRNAKILFVTGERREESSARAKYDEAEPHYCNNQKRRVDQWRNVIDYTEADVWALMKKHRVVCHPAYRLGWGRVSCMACIFGDNDQWASVRHIAAERFERIAQYEQEFGCTIKRGESVTQQADRGTAFVQNAPDSLIRLAMSQDYPADQIILPEGEEWQTPVGAHKRCGGPT